MNKDVARGAFGVYYFGIGAAALYLAKRCFDLGIDLLFYEPEGDAPCACCEDSDPEPNEDTSGVEMRLAYTPFVAVGTEEDAGAPDGIR